MDTEEIIIVSFSIFIILYLIIVLNYQQLNYLDKIYVIFAIIVILFFIISLKDKHIDLIFTNHFIFGIYVFILVYFISNKFLKYLNLFVLLIVVLLWCIYRDCILIQYENIPQYLNNILYGSKLIYFILTVSCFTYLIYSLFYK